MIIRTTFLLFIFLASFILGQPYYKGDWINGRYHGKGVFVDASGSKYEGDFFKGRMHGYGIQEYYNGAKFEGEYIGGKRSYGTYYFANGGKYIGGWKNGKQHGEGIFINEYGVEEKQIWSEGKLLNDDEKEESIDTNLSQLRKLPIGTADNKKLEKKQNREVAIKQVQKIALGDSLFNLQKYEDAENLYKEAIKLDPLNSEAYVRLGNLLYDKDLYDDSKKRYEKAIELNPNSSAALNGLGNIRYQNSDFQTAIDYYQQANELNTSSEIIVDNLANVFDLIGEKYKAIEYYETLTSLNENDLQSKYWLGDTYSTKNKTKAIKIFEEILEKMQDEQAISSIGNREKDFAIISYEGLEKSRTRYRYDKDWLHNKLWGLGAKKAM